MTGRRRVAVVGGGVAGLAAAHRLVERGGTDAVLLEAGDRLGGSVGSERRDGFLVERGADSFITEKPWALALAERIGFAARLVGTREGERRTFVVHRGGLVPVPPGFLLLAPSDLGALLASPLFSPVGKLRMALDLVLPRGAEASDESLADFVRRRFGREALERVAQPLAAGIYTADAERLSLAATMPRFRDLEARHRSVILGLRAAKSGAGHAGARYGLFVAPAEGMGAFVDAIARRLPEGVVRPRAPVSGLAREGGRWRLHTDGEPLAADAVVLATPAFVTAALVRTLDPVLAAGLASIEYASSVTVTLAYRSAELPALHGFGFVVPAAERRPLLACTYASRKFPGRAPAGHDLVRAFLGGALRPELVALDDTALVTIVRAELEQLAGVRAEPLFVVVRRYERAMPQYAVGHLERVAAIEARAQALPGLALAGAAYRGVGVPDCVRSGETAADRVLGLAGPESGVRAEDASPW